MTIYEFIQAHNIGMSVEPTDSNPNMADSEKMDHWKVCLHRGKSRMTLVFSMGSAHHGKEPATADVLDCLASDASGMNGGFEDWCSETGYDSDSRWAERTYNTIRNQTTRLERFLGPVAFETLLYHTERE